MIAGAWRRIEVLFEDEKVFFAARGMVPIVYFFFLFLAFHFLGQWQELSEPAVEYLWPVAWVSMIPLAPDVIAAIFLLILVAAALAGVVRYQSRLVRAFVFLAILFYQAFYTSIVGEGHNFYALLFLSFFFIFIPQSVWGKERQINIDDRKTFLMLVWGFQALFLMMYSLSGLIKVISGIISASAGDSHIFLFESAALYVANLLPQFGNQSILGPLIVEYPLLGWLPLMVFLYILSVSFVVAFRPVLHQTWGVLLLLFHLATMLSVHLILLFNIFLVVLLFIHSPFRPVQASMRDIVYDLPIFGGVVRFIRSHIVSMKRIDKAV